MLQPWATLETSFSEVGSFFGVVCPPSVGLAVLFGFCFEHFFPEEGTPVVSVSPLFLKLFAFFPQQLKALGSQPR